MTFESYIQMSGISPLLIQEIYTNQQGPSNPLRQTTIFRIDRSTGSSCRIEVGRYREEGALTTADISVTLRVVVYAVKHGGWLLLSTRGFPSLVRITYISGELRLFGSWNRTWKLSNVPREIRELVGQMYSDTTR